MDEEITIFPKHKCGLYLQHNPHLDIYETVERWLKDYDDMYNFRKGHEEICIRNNEIWTLQWYPDTPIGFIAVASYSLKELLKMAMDSS